MMITVIDSQCGTGKTEWAIKYMNENHEKTKFMYITPFLTEIERIKKSVSFNISSPKEGSKYKSFKAMIQSKQHIVSTHSLFTMGDEHTAESISFNDYELILDEVLDVLEPLGLRKCDVTHMIDKGLITIEDDNSVSLTEYGTKMMNGKTKYENELELISKGRVILVNKDMMLWKFPVDMLKCFKNVIVLTYMFDQQVMANYMLSNGCNFKFKFLFRYKLYDGKCPYGGGQYNKLINIYTGKLNLIGKRVNALNSVWYENKNNYDKLKNLSNNTYNYFAHISKVSSEKTLWTCPKKIFDKGKITVNGHKSSFLVMTARATNDYSHKNVLAYLSNRYQNPILQQYFNAHSLSVNNDIYALSELIQWVFRSAIRRNEPINLYIPSSRMRNLLTNWLNDIPIIEGEYNDGEEDNYM